MKGLFTFLACYVFGKPAKVFVALMFDRYQAKKKKKYQGRKNRMEIARSARKKQGNE